MHSYERRVLTTIEIAFNAIEGDITSESIEKAIQPHLQGMDVYDRSRFGRMLWDEAKETLERRMAEGKGYKYYPLAQHLDPIVGGA